MSKINLYDTLQSSYGDKKADSNLEKKGYIKDKKFSNDNQQVWYNPNRKDLMVNVAGTHNLKDIGSDIYLALGRLKSTNRYKEADKVLKDAKKFYQPNNTIITGHSLGSSIGAGIASKNDKFVGLDAGYTIGQKTRGYSGKHENYRTSGDLVSILGANAKNMQTLKASKNNFIENVADKLTGGLYNSYKAHTDFSNIRDKQIRIR